MDPTVEARGFVTLLQYSTNPSPHFFLPRGVIRSALVSETGGPEAKPGEAVNSNCNSLMQPLGRALTDAIRPSGAGRNKFGGRLGQTHSASMRSVNVSIRGCGQASDAFLGTCINEQRKNISRDAQRNPDLTRTFWEQSLTAYAACGRQVPFGLITTKFRKRRSIFVVAVKGTCTDAAPRKLETAGYLERHPVQPV